MSDPAHPTIAAAVRAHLREQGRGAARLGSPFTAMLCALAAERLDRGSAVGRAMLSWPGAPGADALGLRWTGALHGLVRDGLAPELAACYPPALAAPERLWQAIAAAHRTHEARLLDWLASPPQTNEVGRSAMLLAGALEIAAATGRALDWREIGASAGLNLRFDRLAYQAGDWRWGPPDAPLTLRPEWRGAPPPADAPLALASRAGCDRMPVDPCEPADATRLMAYIWPDMPDRLARMEAAIALARAVPARLEAMDAADWVARELRHAHPERCLVIAHTVMWQYLPAATQARIEAALAEAGARASPSRPLARLGFEWIGEGTGEAVLTLWPSGETRRLGRAHMHGAWIDWRGWAGAEG